MVYTGDRPGVGSYVCLSCGYVHPIEQDDEALPPCPVCGGLEWERMGS